MKNFSKKYGEEFRRIIRFGMVGFCNAVISYLIYYLTLKVCQYSRWLPKYDYIFGSVFSFFISVFCSYLLNRRFTFQRDGIDTNNTFMKDLLKTYISYGITGLLLANALLYFEIEYLKMSKLLAPVINLVITVPLNYILNKRWVFKI